MTDNDDLIKAKKKVQEKKVFLLHVVFFGLINALFFIINMVSSPHRLWFFYPFFGWLIGGLLTHYLVVFGLPSFGVFSEEWEEKEIEYELKKIRKNRTNEPIHDKLDDEQLNLERQFHLHKRNKLRGDYGEDELV